MTVDPIPSDMPPEAQIEMAKIRTLASSNKSIAKIQGLAVTAVGLVLSAVVFASVILSVHDKPLPEFYGAVVSIAITGLVSVLSYNAGKSSGGQGGGAR